MTPIVASPGRRAASFSVALTSARERDGVQAHRMLRAPRTEAAALELPFRRPERTTPAVALAEWLVLTSLGALAVALATTG